VKKYEHTTFGFATDSRHHESSLKYNLVSAISKTGRFGLDRLAIQYVIFNEPKFTFIN